MALKAWVYGDNRGFLLRITTPRFQYDRSTEVIIIDIFRTVILKSRDVIRK